MAATSARDACTPPPRQALVPFPPARAESLAGTYQLVLVANDGPQVGKHASGVIHLALNDTLHRYYTRLLGGDWYRRGDRPLVGWAEIDIHDIGLATAGTPLSSRDSTLPGIASSLDSLQNGLRFMLGYRPALDGGFNELVVTRYSRDGFAGQWLSSIGPTSYHAGGYFCAWRRSEP